MLPMLIIVSARLDCDKLRLNSNYSPIWNISMTNTN